MKDILGLIRALNNSLSFPSQFVGAIALAFVCGGADASPAWVLCGVAIPCVLAIAEEAARRIGERRAIAGGAELCDVAIDPLAPDWHGTAQGMIDVFAHAIVESRNVRMRFLPCGGNPYRITVLPPKRNSVKPRLLVARIERGKDPTGQSIRQASATTSSADSKNAIEIPAISVRIPMPIEIVDSMETIWISPIGKRIRLLRCPPEVLRLERAIAISVASIAAIIALCGFFRIAILVALCLALRFSTRQRSWIAPHVLWISILAIATILCHDFAPSFFGDPLRVAFYAYILPIALWRGYKRFSPLKAKGKAQ